MKKILLFIILSFSTLLKTQESSFTENQKSMYNGYVDILSRLNIPDKFQNKQDEYKADKAISLSLLNSDFIRYLYTDNKFVRRNTKLLKILFNKLSNSKKVSLLKDILIKNKSKDTVIKLINYVDNVNEKNKLILDLFNALKSKDRVISKDGVELFSGLNIEQKIALFSALKTKERVALIAELKENGKTEIIDELSADLIKLKGYTKTSSTFNIETSNLNFIDGFTGEYGNIAEEGQPEDLIPIFSFD